MIFHLKIEIFCVNKYNHMTEYTYCGDCKVDISYIKDINRYVTCPKCRADIYVGTEKTHKWGKHKRIV